MSDVIKKTFNDVSAGYDDEALAFFARSASSLARRLVLEGDECVLDVATGTGHLALSMAKLLPQGHVTGVDFSQGMLSRAREKAERQNVRNLELLELNMQNLGLMEATFDVAVCGFGLFFVEDMVEQLRLISSTVKPGGLVAISTFEDGHFFNPLIDLMFERLKDYGVERPSQTWKNVATDLRCTKVFEQAGLTDVRVESENVGYYLDGPDAWWSVIWNGGLRRVVEKLSPDDREKFRTEHLKEIELLRTDEGIWLDVGVLFTLGTKK